MDSSSSPKNPKLPEAKQDLISNLPTIATDKILKRLPLPMAAKLSVLSRKWRHDWLSHRYLVFDKAFWVGHCKNGKIDWEEGISIINNVLFHHNGPVHKFYLIIGDASFNNTLHLSRWLSFISRTGVKKMTLALACGYGKPLPSHIFFCKELVKLTMQSCILNTLPRDFKGFAFLRSLKLSCIVFKKQDIFSSLIACCSRLTVLSLEHWIGMKNLVVIDIPNLEHLNILGCFESLVFKNVPQLRRLSLSVFRYEKGRLKAETVDSIKIIPDLCKLHVLHLGGTICKLLAADHITKSLALDFNHLCGLSLSDLDLDDFDVFCYTFVMLQRCPQIKQLRISVIPTGKVVEHKFEYNENYKLGHLLMVEITNITGSSAELKLIKYLLSVAVVLENLLYRCHGLDASSELKVTRELLQLSRASTKAKLVCLE